MVMIMMKMMEKVSDGHNVEEPWRFRSSWSWRTFLLPSQAFPDINTMAMFPDINTMAMFPDINMMAIFPDINTMAMFSIMMMKPFKSILIIALIIKRALVESSVPSPSDR